MFPPNQVPCECEIHAGNMRCFGGACREGAVQNINRILGYPTENAKQRCLQRFFCDCRLIDQTQRN